jgi:hypothetical protein
MSDNEVTGDEELVCAYCREPHDLSEDDPNALDNGDSVYCDACGETSYMWNGELVDDNDLHEFQCDSRAAARTEEYAHGGRDDDFSPESFRSEW